MPPNAHGLQITGLGETLHPDERILLILRRHWIVYAYLGFYTVVFIIVLIILLTYQSAVFSLVSEAVFYPFLIIASSVFLLFLYTAWINTELDLFIITEERIRLIEQVSFLNRTISECSLEDIKEVNAGTKGLLENLFHFGTISLSTASKNSHFVLRFAPNPIESASSIRNIIQESKTKKKEQQSTTV